MNYQSAIFSQYLSDEIMLATVSDDALIKKMLLFEIALAKSQAKLGMMPQASADEIAVVLEQIVIAPADLASGTLQNGVPVITLLSIVKEKLSDESKRYLHYGATSQDAMDTAQVLIIQDALVLIREKINSFIQQLTKLSEQYGDTPCMGRTRGQLAVPVTFGLKINAWLQPMMRQLQRLNESSERILQVQLGGAAGNLPAYPDKAGALIIAVADELKLSPSGSWHTQRDSLCEFGNWLAMLTGILGKMGADILVMSQSEMDEVRENTEGGKSSAMPHKNNPVLSEALVAIARINASLQSQLLMAMIHVNERDATAWILEWNAIPQMLINTSAALNHALTISANMKVNTDNMRRNVERFNKNIQ